MSQVSIVRCNSYQQEKVDDAVRKSVELIGGLNKIVHPQDKVLLKVNVLNADPPEKAVTTHPAVLKAVIRLVKEAGGKPVVGDAPGIAYKDAEKAWQITGLKKAAEEEGAEVVTFRWARQVESSFSKKVPYLHIAREALDADVVISIPKLKTHSFALFTGAIKNLYGTIPGFRKKELHARAPKPRDFARLMADILFTIHPALAIMDGIIGMEGNGPAAGSPRKVGLVLASRDLVALDAVASSIIGYDPLDVDIIRIAAEKGLGVAELGKIDVKGTDLEKVKLDDFELVSNINTLLNKIPSFLLFIGRFVAPYLLKVEPEINRERCTGCGICIEHCPTGAARLSSRVPEINRKKCIKCFCCQEFCPQKAVEIKYSWLARKLRI